MITILPIVDVESGARASGNNDGLYLAIIRPLVPVIQSHHVGKVEVSV